MGASLIRKILRRSSQNNLQNMRPAKLFSNNTQLNKNMNLCLQAWLVLDSAMAVTETTRMSKAKHTLKCLCWIWALARADNNPAVCAVTPIQYLPSFAQSTSSCPSSYNYGMCDLIENSSITKLKHLLKVYHAITILSKIIVKC